MMGFDCYIVTLDTFRGRDNDGGGRGFDRYEPARERGGFGGFSRDRNDRGNQNFSVVAVCLLTFVSFYVFFYSTNLNKKSAK